MIALDLTNELAPLIWTMEGLMLVAVIWLVAMFFADQIRPTEFRSRPRSLAADREATDLHIPSASPTSESPRIAA